LGSIGASDRDRTGVSKGGSLLPYHLATDAWRLPATALASSGGVLTGLPRHCSLRQPPSDLRLDRWFLERMTGFEPATVYLASRNSTTELHPHGGPGGSRTRVLHSHPKPSTEIAIHGWLVHLRMELLTTHRHRFQIVFPTSQRSFTPSCYFCCQVQHTPTCLLQTATRAMSATRASYSASMSTIASAITVSVPFISVSPFTVSETTLSAG
jgi:hypothetical protein